MARNIHVTVSNFAKKEKPETPLSPKPKPEYIIDYKP